MKHHSPNPDDVGRFLSVSSNGSNWVKHSGDARATGREIPFSILERIELGETGEAGDQVHPALPFQYPRTDRIG